MKKGRENKPLLPLKKISFFSLYFFYFDKVKMYKKKLEVCCFFYFIKKQVRNFLDVFNQFHLIDDLSINKKYINRE